MNELSRFEDLRLKVIEWASVKGIFEKGTPEAQAWKTLEEAQEILDGILNKNKEEIKDSIGDTLVTLIIQAEMQGMNPLDCLETAYNVIAKRKGKMIDGQFVKEK
jgi:NTP pyrophosphatase (non-canonical NTP hydrolase)